VRIVCGYTPAKLRPETVAALEACGRPYDLVDVSASDHAYFDLLRAYWAARADFLIVEHDMAPAPEMFDLMEDCPRPWCVNGYTANAAGRLTETAFGFTRFRAAFMAAHPDAFEAAAADFAHLTVYGHRWPGTHWRGLDCRFDCVMGARRVPHPHQHAPAVTHLRHWSDIGFAANG
jgi:hypothetical protein